MGNESYLEIGNERAFPIHHFVRHTTLAFLQVSLPEELVVYLFHLTQKKAELEFIQQIHKTIETVNKSKPTNLPLRFSNSSNLLCDR